MVNNLNIFKALVLLIFGINNIFCQSAEEILKKAQEKSLISTDSYYKFKIESQLDNETRHIVGTMDTHDGPHGLNAFLNKEKPRFMGS